MSHDYTEVLLVEQPAVTLLQELEWQILSAKHETFGEGSTLGRQTMSEVVLLPRLSATLSELNPNVPQAALSTAIDELTRDRISMGLPGANREVYQLLKEGVRVSLPAPDGSQREERVRFIDWEDPLENDFLVVSQMKVTGPMYSCIPDLVGFVNGLPLLVIEFKKPGVPAQNAFEDNLTSYKHELNGVPSLFPYNALLITSNGTDSRVGSLTADWDRFFEWKRIEREDEPKHVSLEKLLRGTCEPSRLLDLIENFTLFSDQSGGGIKVLGQNHQFLGVNNAIRAMEKAKSEGHGRGGVFWQTQGSGKSYSMVFFSQKILRKLPGNWTFVVVTDRVELDDQIAKTFKAVGAINDAESKTCHAQSGRQLRELLRGNHRYVFTLIHKFQTDEVLCDRGDVIVLVDEAHRSQYDILAMNMRAALPKALFVAFTGTPLMAGEERTKDVFGDYVSVYDFQSSVEDKATVPLFYENRTPELQLENPDLNEQMYELIEAADLSDEAQKKLDKELSKQYHLLTRDDRLDTVAKDVVRHFLGRGLIGDNEPGKAMVVSIDKATALRMHEKVRKCWALERRRVVGELAKRKLHGGETEELTVRLKVIDSTDMAVIVSPGQNEIEEMKAKGLDMVPHRERMNKEELDEKFKDPGDPLRLVFVCAMWLTGFDAPSCSTVYLDKPMRNHTLMQTIARANRVYPNKHSGMIVDYANVFLSLEKALAIYGVGAGGQRPVTGKEKLIEELKEAAEDAKVFCLVSGINLDKLTSLPLEGFSRLEGIRDAVDAFIAPDAHRKNFLQRQRLVRVLYDAVKPDPIALSFTALVALLNTIANDLWVRLNPHPVDIAHVMESINELLDNSISGVGMRVEDSQQIDLSKIDFKALQQRFAKSKHKNSELEALKAAIRAQLERMVFLNETRTDFLEKFEELVNAYNAGAANIEDLFRQLLELTDSLSNEEQRHVREHLTEEELVVFDILTRPAPKLSAEEKAEVKKVAKLLLERMRAMLVPDWRTRQGSRSQVKLVIEDVLDDGLPRKYTPDIYSAKCATLFEHFFEKYPDAANSAYASAR
jgi:type I restriction enzyme, R subunit